MKTKTVTVIVLILCLLANIVSAGTMSASMANGKPGKTPVQAEIELTTQAQHPKQKGLKNIVFNGMDQHAPCHQQLSHQQESAPHPCCEQDCSNCVSNYAAPVICFSNLITYINSSISKPSGQFPSLRPVKHYRPPII